MKDYLNLDTALTYISVLTTLELCLEFHRKDDPNQAIRNCCIQLIPRLNQQKEIQSIITNLAKQPLASVHFLFLKQDLEQIMGGQLSFH